MNLSSAVFLFMSKLFKHGQMNENNKMLHKLMPNNLLFSIFLDDSSIVR